MFLVVALIFKRLKSENFCQISQEYKVDHLIWKFNNHLIVLYLWNEAAWLICHVVWTVSLPRILKWWLLFFGYHFENLCKFNSQTTRRIQWFFTSSEPEKWWLEHVWNRVKRQILVNTRVQTLCSVNTRVQTLCSTQFITMNIYTWPKQSLFWHRFRICSHNFILTIALSCVRVLFPLYMYNTIVKPFEMLLMELMFRMSVCTRFHCIQDYVLLHHP